MPNAPKISPGTIDLSTQLHVEGDGEIPIAHKPSKLGELNNARREVRVPASNPLPPLASLTPRLRPCMRMIPPRSRPISPSAHPRMAWYKDEDEEAGPLRADLAPFSQIPIAGASSTDNLAPCVAPTPSLKASRRLSRP
jgi:hypothetical protein